jgi:hypothetical protein
MATQVFITLRADKLSIGNLAGLCTETIEQARPVEVALGALGAAKLSNLITVTTDLKGLMSRNRKSTITTQIKDADANRDMLTADVFRSVNTATKSSTATTAAAGVVLAELLHPFKGISTARMPTQTAQLKLVEERYVAQPELAKAAATLGLADTFTSLFAANTTFEKLYSDRLNELATSHAPAASSVRGTTAKGYEDFCIVVAQTLNSIPNAELEKLFAAMNDLRRKYIGRSSRKVAEKATSEQPQE